MLSSLIKNYTNDPYNHVSISFNKELTKMYSFGRKYANSPWLGGFIKEDVHSKILKNSNTLIFELEITNQQYVRLQLDINYFKGQQQNLQYNFFGLLAMALGIPLKRSDAYFCSEFIATLFVRAGIAPNLDPQFTSPMDLITISNLKEIYRGSLDKYVQLVRFSNKEILQLNR